MRFLVVAVLVTCTAGCHSSSGASGAANPPGDPDLDRDTFAASVDCNDNDAAVWRIVNVFADSDRDGIGAGQVVNVCAGRGAPAGFSTTSTDCAPDDSAMHTLMAYAARDADGDTVLIASAGSVCGDGSTLAARYFDSATTAATDCDDGNASAWQLAQLYEDFDRDGVGHGALLSVCAGTGAPPGFTNSNIDCAPLETTKWRVVATYSDVDGDGVGSGPLLPLCVGSGPPPGSSFLGFDPIDNSALVSDFDFNMPSLLVEQDEAGFDL
jgi:hypothetical protein